MFLIACHQWLFSAPAGVDPAASFDQKGETFGELAGGKSPLPLGTLVRGHILCMTEKLVIQKVGLLVLICGKIMKNHSGSIMFFFTLFRQAIETDTVWNTIHWAA